MIRILSKFILILCLILDPVEKVVFFLQIGDEGFSKSGQPSTWSGSGSHNAIKS